MFKKVVVTLVGIIASAVAESAVEKAWDEHTRKKDQSDEIANLDEEDSQYTIEKD